MDIISINKANHLYWLGRYTERTHITINYLRKFYDLMVDKDEKSYFEFCSRLGITEIYEDKNEFIKSIIADNKKEFSIAYCLDRAYDNAVVLRDILTSRTLSYMQMASNDLNRCIANECRMLDLYNVIDNLIAFWGAIDDYIIEDNVRDLIKAGKYAERIEFYKRFDEENSLIDIAAHRFTRYVKHLEIDSGDSAFYEAISSNGEIDLNSVKKCINELFKLEVVQ